MVFFNKFKSEVKLETHQRHNNTNYLVFFSFYVKVTLLYDENLATDIISAYANPPNRSTSNHWQPKNLFA